MSYRRDYMFNCYCYFVFISTLLGVLSTYVTHVMSNYNNLCFFWHIVIVYYSKHYAVDMAGQYS